VKRYRFDASAAWPVSDCGSSFSLARLLWAKFGEVRVDIVYLRAGDHVGEHQAGLPQLFCVVVGAGWATGPDDKPRKFEVTPGDAVFWVSGERHAAGTETGMRAIIIQAESLDPDATLELVDSDADVGAFRDA
jgi:hypothetical protein